jgi:hypothetical protein
VGGGRGRGWGRGTRTGVGGGEGRWRHHLRGEHVGALRVGVVGDDEAAVPAARARSEGELSRLNRFSQVCLPLCGLGWPIHRLPNMEG